jgi:hypothetical protein
MNAIELVLFERHTFMMFKKQRPSILEVDEVYFDLLHQSRGFADRLLGMEVQINRDIIGVNIL